MKSRATRRQHTARAKAACRRWGELHVFALAPELWTEVKKTQWVNRTYQHPQSCSCEGCCNARGREKGKKRLTLQERRALDSTDS